MRCKKGHDILKILLLLLNNYKPIRESLSLQVKVTLLYLNLVILNIKYFKNMVINRGFGSFSGFGFVSDCTWLFRVEYSLTQIHIFSGCVRVGFQVGSEIDTHRESCAP